MTKLDRTTTPRTTGGCTTIADWLNLSHELRTPANAILGHAELLLSGALGPLSAEMRASIGDMQKAGLGLLTQIQLAIEKGQALSASGSSAADIDALVNLLSDCLPVAQGMANTAIGTSSFKLQAWPVGSLRVVAILLHDMGVIRPEPGHEGNLSTSGCGSDIRRYPENGLRLECTAMDGPYHAIHLSMIEMALAMTGGKLDSEEQGALVLSWSAEEGSLPLPCAAAEEAVQGI